MPWFSKGVKTGLHSLYVGKLYSESQAVSSSLISLWALWKESLGHYEPSWFLPNYFHAIDRMLGRLELNPGEMANVADSRCKISLTRWNHG